MERTKDKLFVYGSLKPRYPLWKQIKDQVENPQDGSVAGKLRGKENGGFPALDIHLPGLVKGVLFDVIDQNVWLKLDMIEGVPHLFKYDSFPIETDKGIYEKATVYYAVHTALLEWPQLGRDEW